MAEIRLDAETGIFVWSDDIGVRLYNIEPLAEIGRLETGSTLSACNLGRSNILSLVGGGERPKFSQNTLVIYNGETSESVLDITFSAVVLRTILSPEYSIAILYEKVYIFAISDGKLILEAKTRRNPRGLCDFKSNRLAVPGYKKGSVHVYDINTYREKRTSCPPTQISAHQGEIASFVMNSNGKLLATASNKGTLIRVWDSVTKRNILEFRRGADPARIYSMNFSRDSAFLAATGDKGTLHVFAVKEKLLNKTSAFARAGKVAMLPTQYTNSLWAVATAPIPEEVKTEVAFLGGNKLVAVSADGNLHLYQFSQEGSINRVEVQNINELDINDDNW